jgi:hypothetical protein
VWQADDVLLLSAAADVIGITSFWAYMEAAWSAELRDHMVRLASGDTEGRVVVWDVASGGVTVALEDALTVSSGRQHRKPAAVVRS